MLSKLLKYEFRATARIFLPMYAILLVMSVAARFLYGAQMTQAQGTLLNILTVIVTIAVIGLLTAVVVVTVILICRRFWNNLLGREGYLMNVLPVSSSAHVWAKLIAAAVWNVLSAVLCIAALFIMLSRFADLGSFARLREVWTQLWTLLRAEGIAGQTRLLIAFVAVFSLLSLLSSVLEIYAAMCIGQLANKHRIWASVGAYFGLGIVRSVLYSRLLMLRALHYTGARAGSGLHFELSVNSEAMEAFNDVRTALPALNTELLWMLALTLLVCAALFVVTQWLLKKHLNLQ